MCRLFFVLSFFTSCLLAADRPNVVVILSDDQGWGDLSCNGNRNLETPNIDRLRDQGAYFERFYVCPVCSPTRAEFLTGRYHVRGGVYSTSAGGERLDLDEVTIAQSFQAAGYRTAAFGKWHNGTQHPYHPNSRGFDEFYGFCSGHWAHYFSPLLDHNGDIVQGDGFVIDDFTNRAIDFIQASDDRPFFVYLPYNTPHSPMQVPDRWWRKFRDKSLEQHHREPEKENRQHLRAALAMCENIDWNVGRLLKSLDDCGKSRNTIVVYFCDNGPNGFRWNGDMKGRKGSTDEGGVRSPCIVRWPEKIPAGHVVRRNGAALDLHPTLAALAGVDTVNQRPFDGVDLSNDLLEPTTVSDDRVIVSYWRNRVSAKSGVFRFDANGRLYDLEKDPGQRVDIADNYVDLVQRFRIAVQDFRKKVLPELGDDRRPFVVAHPDCKVTQIPARDGKTVGGIRRSNKFPNASFFTNWTSIDDSINWNVEVATAGSFEAEIFYTCPPGQEGSVIELSMAGASCTAKVTVPKAKTEVGADSDRFRRVESYTQDWARMSLGTIKLPAGPGTLTLKATHVAGDSVLDFRLLLLRRQASDEG